MDELSSYTSSGSSSDTSWQSTSSNRMKYTPDEMEKYVKDLVTSYKENYLQVESVVSDFIVKQHVPAVNCFRSLTSAEILKILKHLGSFPNHEQGLILSSITDYVMCSVCNGFLFNNFGRGFGCSNMMAYLDKLASKWMGFFRDCERQKIPEDRYKNMFTLLRKCSELLNADSLPEICKTFSLKLMAIVQCGQLKMRPQKESNEVPLTCSSNIVKATDNSKIQKRPRDSMLAADANEEPKAQTKKPKLQVPGPQKTATVQVSISETPFITLRKTPDAIEFKLGIKPKPLHDNEQKPRLPVSATDLHPKPAASLCSSPILPQHKSVCSSNPQTVVNIEASRASVKENAFAFMMQRSRDLSKAKKARKNK